MSQTSKESIEFQGKVVHFKYSKGIRYYNASQAAKYFMVKEGKRSYEKVADFIRNYLSDTETRKYNESWEKANNKNFGKISKNEDLKVDEFVDFYLDKEHKFSITDWISQGAIGIKVKKGRKGYILFNEDLFMFFLSKNSPDFHVFLSSEFRRLSQPVREERVYPYGEGKLFKDREEYRRARVKIAQSNKPVTKAVQEKRKAEGKETKFFHYSNEMDMLNEVFFGEKAKTFKEKSGSRGNQRDEIEDIEEQELFVKIEEMNAWAIEQGTPFQKRKEMLKRFVETKREMRKELEERMARERENKILKEEKLAKKQAKLKEKDISFLD